MNENEAKLHDKQWSNQHNSNHLIIKWCYNRSHHHHNQYSARSLGEGRWRKIRTRTPFTRTRGMWSILPKRKIPAPKMNEQWNKIHDKQWSNQHNSNYMIILCIFSWKTQKINDISFKTEIIQNIKLYYE